MPFDRANAVLVGVLYADNRPHAWRLVQVFAWFDVWQIEVDGRRLVKPEWN